MSFPFRSFIMYVKMQNVFCDRYRFRVSRYIGLCFLQYKNYTVSEIAQWLVDLHA